MTKTMTKTMTEKNNKTKQIKQTEEEKVLKKYFGYNSFRKGQKEIVEVINEGRDVLAVMPTGAGKSICYQVPSLMHDGITIVISPLIALMKDQVENLKQKGISASFVNSSLSSQDIYYTLDNAAKGKYKILYIAPERLLTPNFKEFTKKAKIDILAIDEAHCVSEWGHDFRKSYSDIYPFYKSLKHKPVICAFTATATDKVKKDIKKLLGLKDPYEVSTGFDRPNIYFRTVHTTKKIEYITEYLNKHEDKSGIIYCITRKDVENVTKILNEKGYKVKGYHAGLIEKVRNKVQDDFLRDKTKVIVCTNAFGMGIDKPNVSFVIHYGMPKNLEAYYQEAGRCGRNGELSEAILLFNERDVKLNEFMIDKNEENSIAENEISTRERMNLKKRDLNNLKRMTEYAKTNACLRKNMLSYFGEITDDNCNNCSKCYSKSKLADITLEAQKIMSTIIYLKEKENIDVLINVLRGIDNKTNKKMRDYILDNNLDLIKTYGILKINEKDLRSMISFLHENKFIEIDIDDKDFDKEFFTVTPKGRDVLNKKRYVTMRVSEDYNLVKKEKIKDKNLDETLYNLLKLTRKNIAKKIRLPEFMIIEDASLKEMAIYKPKSMKDIEKISGMGEYKTKKFGEIFLEVIYTYTHM